MNKILLVDDEPIVRIAIKSLVEWEQNGFIIEEACNGKQALKLLNEDTDILVTDINMPIMNGLELIEEINKMKVRPFVLVLSAYDDYNLVRDAFKLDIYDYILKNQIESENLLEVIKKANDMRMKSLKKEKKLSFNTNKRDVLKKLLLEEKCTISKEELKENKMKLNPSNLCVSYILIDDYNKIKDRYASEDLKMLMESVVNCSTEVLKKFNTGEIIYLSPDEYLLITSIQDNSLSKVREKNNEILDSIRRSLKNYLDIKFTAGVSDLEDGYDVLHKLFKEAENNARLRYIVGKGRNIYSEDCKYLHRLNINMIDKKDKSYIDKIQGINELDKLNFNKLLKLIIKEKGLLQALDEMNKKKIFEEIDKVINEINKFKADRIETLYVYYFQIIFIVIQYLATNYKNLSEFDYINIDFYKQIMDFETKKEIDTWIKNLLEDFVDKLKECDDTPYVVKRAKVYIEENYMNKITLEMVSKHLGVSEGYLSTIFTKELGQPFSNYVINIRIHNAKHFLINSHMKIYEISQSVGFSSVEHFSRTFKKVTGCSPKQFKGKRV